MVLLTTTGNNACANGSVANVKNPNWSSAVTVAEILAAKGSNVITIKPSETIATLCECLREKRIGAAIVSSDGKTVDGVISERDVAFGLAVHKSDLHALPVSALMTKAVITCSPSDSVALVASTMLARNIRHLPVEDQGRVVGMISIRDVLNWRVSELQHQTGLLSAFVSESERNPPVDR
jgi:CBS domain-containing protein